MGIKKTCGTITLELDRNENFTRIVEKGDYEVIYDGFGTYLTVVIETGVQIKYQFGKIRMDSLSPRRSYGIEDYGKSYRWKQNND